MKLDTLSKECLIFGSLTLIASLALIAVEAEELTRIHQRDYSEGKWNPFYLSAPLLGLSLGAIRLVLILQNISDIYTSCISVTTTVIKVLSNLTKEHCLVLLAVVAVALISILSILGIIKRRAFLLAPWLLAAFGGVSFSIYIIWFNLIAFPFAPLEFLVYAIGIIGMETVVLYPLCTLFAEFRRERANIAKQDKSLTVAI